MKTKYKIALTIGVILIISGLGIFLYSPISNLLNERNMQNSINDYENAVSQMYNDTDTSELQNQIDKIQSERSTDYTVSDYIRKH